MPGMSGEVLVESVCRAQPSTPVLALSTHPESAYAVRVLKAGAKGYLNKAASAKEFLKAVEAVRVGRYYVGAEASTSLLAFLANRWEVVPHDQLSTREFQVLTMLASGQSPKEIASELHITVNSVSTYRGRVLEKLNLKGNADLTRYAVEQGLVRKSAKLTICASGL
jgi:DNA-binding NarL/FixJ family response regulator